MMQSHPFTIASLSWQNSRHGRNDLVLLIKALQGFTKNLAQLATNHKMSNQSVDRFTAIAESQKLRISTRAWIDGPYGDVHPALDQQYHGIVCVAGGSGITASLPWISHLANRMRSAVHGSINPCRTRSVHLIWSIRSLDWIRWADREICDALHDVMIANQPSLEEGKLDEIMPVKPNKPTGRLKISIFVTSSNVSETEMSAARLDMLLAAGVSSDDQYVQVEIVRGRPSYTGLLPDMMDKKRNIVLGKPLSVTLSLGVTNISTACGPQGQKIDLANSVAQLQRLIIDNTSKEIALHTETFGW
jgi:hypothetical protein